MEMVWRAAGSILLIGTLLSAATGAPRAQAAVSPVKSLGNFSHIVANLDRSLAFYRDGLGLEVTGPAAVFRPDQVIMKLANVPGAQTRYTWLKIPGSPMAVELIEYKDIDRAPVSPRFQDPGATTLSVRVRELDGTIARLKTLGGRVITVAGVPAEIGGRSRIVFMQDPDGFVDRAEPGARRRRGAAPEHAGERTRRELRADDCRHGQDDRVLSRSARPAADGRRSRSTATR